MFPVLAGPWRQPAFVRLWIAQTVSCAGSHVTALALPLTAALLLDATAMQMGALVASERVAAMVLGLVAGALIDRLPRRPILAAADLGRALLLGTIPVLALADSLRIEHLYGIAFLVGLLGVCAELAQVSYLPSIVRSEHLAQANGASETGRSVVGVVAPGLAGLLLQVVMAPVAIALDALSFFLSGLLTATLPEPRRLAPGSRRSLWTEIAEGVTVVCRDRLLRAMAGCSTSFNLFNSMAGAVSALYLLRQLGVGPFELGLLAATAGPGAALGACLAAPLARRIGIGPVLVGGLLLSATGAVLVPLAGGSALVVAVMLGLSGALAGFWGPIWGVNVVSLRQQIVPAPLLGRVNATSRTLVVAASMLGALIGGFAGDVLGMREALLLSGVGIAVTSLWVLLSPLWTVGREQQASIGFPERRPLAA